MKVFRSTRCIVLLKCVTSLTSFSRYPARTSVSFRSVTLHFPLRGRTDKETPKERERDHERERDQERERERESERGHMRMKEKRSV